MLSARKVLEPGVAWQVCHSVWGPQSRSQRGGKDSLLSSGSVSGQWEMPRGVFHDPEFLSGPPSWQIREMIHHTKNKHTHSYQNGADTMGPTFPVVPPRPLLTVRMHNGGREMCLSLACSAGGSVCIISSSLQNRPLYGRCCLHPSWCGRGEAIMTTEVGPQSEAPSVPDVCRGMLGQL